MPKVLKLDRGAEEGVRELLRFLLESGKVKGVFTLARTGKQGAVGYSLMAAPGALEDAQPLFPLMPANMGKQLSHLTLKEAAPELIAVVLRPCELRAFIELVKRNEGSLENFFIISSTCGGVYPLKMAADGNIEERLPQYWDAVKKGENAADIRPTCASCEHFAPYGADMTVALIGNKDIDTQCEVSLNTGKAEELAAGTEGGILDQETGTGAAELLLGKRQTQKKELLDELGDGTFDMEKVFAQCIGCRGCSKSCPICYCELCFFESGVTEHEPSYYETELAKMGCTQALPDKVFYHLVRLFHVSVSCVGCGLCTDVCPAALPVSLVSLKTSGVVQKAFNYLPGKDGEEGIPLTTFEPEDFAGII